MLIMGFYKDIFFCFCIGFLASIFWMLLVKFIWRIFLWRDFFAAMVVTGVIVASFFVIKFFYPNLGRHILVFWAFGAGCGRVAMDFLKRK